MRRWHLYVDETGRFDADDPNCAVVGLLVDHALHTQSLRRVRATWEQLVPEVAWPPHSALLRQPLAWVAWQGRGRRADWRQAALALEGLLLELPDWPEVCKALAAGKAFATPALKRCQAHALVHAHAQLNVLRERSRFAVDVQNELLRTLAQSGQLRMIVAAPAEPAARAKGDPYLRLLASLLRRAGDAVLELAGPGHHELCAMVLGRDVLDERLQLRVPLARPHLRAACTSAAGDALARMRRGAATVNLIADRVLRFDGDAPEFAVLADAAANRTFGVIQDCNQGARSRCSALDRATAVPTRLSGTDLPLIASDGLPQDHIEVARRGGFLADSARQLSQSPVFPWAREQAGCWADSLAVGEAR